MDLMRLLDLPAAAMLTVDAGELALVTITHEHADRVVVERKRLGAAIDLHELLGLIGSHGLADTPQVHISAVPVPELAAPVEPAPTPTVHRTTRNGTPDPLSCPYCDRTFKNIQGLGTHRGKAHRGIAVPVEPDPAAPDPAVPPPVAEPEPIAAPEPETAQEQPAPRLGRFVCPYPECGKEYKSQSGYALHIEVAHTTVLPADAPSTPLREYACSACNTPLAGHLRCSDCQALLGPGHDAGDTHMLINGKPLCRTCVAYRGTARELLRTPT